jgi:hypothetical protein
MSNGSDKVTIKIPTALLTSQNRPELLFCVSLAKWKSHFLLIVLKMNWFVVELFCYFWINRVNLCHSFYNMRL